MLNKLLKYELKSLYKFLIIFYCLSLFFGVLTRIFLNIENSLILNIIGQICSGITISMIFNIIINNLMRLWVRFKNNFYGDESYLTHTLPIEKKDLYLSKILVSLITMFTSIVVIALTLFISYYSKENIEILKNILLPVANMYNSSMIKIIIEFLLVFFIEFINILQTGYTGIILGYKMNNNKLLLSVLFGFVAYSCTQIFCLLSIFITSLFNKDLLNLFFTNEMINMDMIKFVIYLALIIYTITVIVGYIVNLKLFKQGVNVD